MIDKLLKVDSTKDNLVDQIQDLQERISELERFALTSQDIKANKIAVGLESVLADIVDGDIATIPWTDYSATSTIVGWSAYTEKVIEYKKIGKQVFVNFRIVGTSDDTAVTFTLPYAEGQTGDPVNMILTRDVSSTWDIGYVNMTGTTATCYQDAASGGFTASGTKGVYGQFRFESI